MFEEESAKLESLASGADLPTLRDQLAESIRKRMEFDGCTWPDEPQAEDVTYGIVDALLPLIERAKAGAAAEALEQAAEFHKRQMGTVGAFDIPLRPGDFAPWLRRRAASLRVTTDQP